jgi:hypothetical protein
MPTVRRSRRMGGRSVNSSSCAGMTRTFPRRSRQAYPGSASRSMRTQSAHRPGLSRRAPVAREPSVELVEVLAAVGAQGGHHLVSGGGEPWSGSRAREPGERVAQQLCMIRASQGEGWVALVAWPKIEDATGKFPHALLMALQDRTPTERRTHLAVSSSRPALVPWAYTEAIPKGCSRVRAILSVARLWRSTPHGLPERVPWLTVDTSVCAVVRPSACRCLR